MAVGDVLTIQAGGTSAFAAAAGAAFPVLYTFTGTAPKAVGTLVIDMDLVALGYPDSVVLLEARCLCTTKAGTANLVAAAVVFSDCVVDVKNITANFGTAAAGGAANPMPAQNNEMTLHPQTTDSGLVSGGGAAFNAVWSVVGGSAIARLTITNASPAAGGNDALCKVFVLLWNKAA